MQSFLSLYKPHTNHEKYKFQYVQNIFSGQEIDLDLEKLLTFPEESYAAAQFCSSPTQPECVEF